MDVKLKSLVQEIVEQACKLKNKHTEETKAPVNNLGINTKKSTHWTRRDYSVNYACVFSQSKEEYENLVEIASKIGKVIKQTPKGPIFHIAPLETVSGKLKLLKIRIQDPTKPERGDADFTVSDYSKFKKKHLSRKGFKLIKRENFEMIELMDSEFNVRVYFSNPPLDKQLGV